tara:strand:- start:331 stop:1962 length:1632 start_codon:yes stop_codon:yes gene_type:complete
MLHDLIKICKILPYSSDDVDYINTHHNTFALEVIDSIEANSPVTLPTLIVGWSKVKEMYPGQSIMNTKISENLFWTFSLTEKEEKNKSDINSFLEYSIKKFFHKNLISYDAIVDGELRDFFLKNINKKIRSFIYFHNNVCYIHNDSDTYAISIPSIDFVGKDSKKILTGLINKVECTLFSYYNAVKYVYIDQLRNVMTTENIFWSKYSYYIEPKDFNKMFLGKDMYRHIPVLMKIIRDNHEVTKDEFNSCLRQTVKDRTTSWLSTNKVYFDPSFKVPDGVRSTWDNGKKYLMLRYSDKRTITGRINCVDSFNPQMLPKDSNIRKQIVSRYNGGTIAVFDYKSFETRLSMYLSRDEEFILSNMNSDLHYNTAKAMFGDIEITKNHRKIAKDVNHAILYGGGDKLILSLISKVDNVDSENCLENVKSFLSPILNTSDYINNVYKELGYIINPFGTLIKPNKSYAAFNNYIQSTATEIVVDKIQELKCWIEKNNSSFMFQVHDSFVMDIHPNDMSSIEDIKSILSKYNDMVFNVDCSLGKTYMECS